MNKWIGIGRLTAAPEIRYTQKGNAVAGFTLAVDSGYGDNKQTDFINIVAWNKLAEVCGNNLDKGRKVLVEGRLQIRSYDANDGTKRRVAEIIAQNIEFLESKHTNNSDSVNHAAELFGGEVFPEEEIPF